MSQLRKIIDAVDTWPDWKLDRENLEERNNRRALGEILPKKTERQQRLEALEKSHAELLDIVKTCSVEHNENDGERIAFLDRRRLKEIIARAKALKEGGDAK